MGGEGDAPSQHLIAFLASAPITVRPWLYAALFVHVDPRVHLGPSATDAAYQAEIEAWLRDRGRAAAVTVTLAGVLDHLLGKAPENDEAIYTAAADKFDSPRLRQMAATRALRQRHLASTRKRWFTLRSGPLSPEALRG